MKVFKILIVMLILIMSVGAVCAAESITDDAIGNDSKEILQTVQGDIATDDSADILETTQNDIYTASDDSFTNLTEEIKSKNVVDLTHDYKFNNETDDSSGIVIEKDNFVLNGNGRTIDGKNLSRIFNITANNVTINDLILINGNAEKGGAIYATDSLTLNNVTFINNYAKTEGGAVGLYGDVTLNCDNTDFTDNYAEAGSAIYVEKGKLNLYNSELSSKIFNKYSQIAALRHSVINIENATFANTSSSYSPALYLRNTKTSIINSKFYNLRGDITAGAIGVRFGGEIYIKNCEFINTTSSKNAGAVYADIAGEGEGGYLTIIDTVFKDTYSDFGGALLQLGGDLFLNNTEFINGHARYNGGSVYLSYVNGAVNNCTFDSNSVDVIEGYPTYGGAILLDMGSYNISESKFFNNNASAGAAIYAYDSAYTISNSIFENNTNPIYSVFDKQAIIDETNIFINDNNISTNNTFYATIMVGQGMQLTLINNTINVTTLPSRYDSRDWGWVSPVRAQGWMGSCWTFGMIGALESALLKATGLRIDLSENNMQDTVIKYSIYGETELVEGGLNTAAASYLLSWLGAFTQDLDSYDEMGKISPVITTTQDIHVQDVIFIANDEVPNGTKLKEAIMKYGSINVNYYGQSQYDEVSLYYNTETYAQYVDVPTQQNHAVTVVGWDDNFPKEKFLTTPPGDGAWIVKNSWGPDWGENGYLYVSYYDQSFVQCGPDELNGHATAVILENTVPYNKNYQYVVTWEGSFLHSAETASYMNVFEALDDDLIAGVGTFFQEGDDNYTVEIYVNDELKLTQNGVTPYMGYHTIKLNEYIPVKEGDVFKAVITTKNIPFMKLDDMRTHYTSNISFVSIDGTPWMDSYSEGVIAVLKVYTVADSNKTNTTNTFTELERLINASGQYLTLDDDYAFDNETDNKNGIVIGKDNFVLNGNGRTIDGNNQSRIFAIGGKNVTLSNLILINGNADNGGAVWVEGTVTLNNVTFINNYATQGGAVALLFDDVLNINNSKFIDNRGNVGSSIYVENGKLNLYNTEFSSGVPTKRSQIVFKEAEGHVDNATFANIVSNYTPAIHMEKSKALTILNSKFINLTANISSGAIGVKTGGVLYIRNCEFINVSSAKNAGAILVDILGMDSSRPGNVTILDTVFRNTSSGFGGAYIQFGGKLIINNTEFTNGHATYNGGSVYISYVDYAEINNCNFTSNGVDIIEGYPTYGGAMVIDMSTISINNSRFINNTASAGSAIYGFDASYDIRNSLFENNTNPIYTLFDKKSSLQNNVYVNDNNVSTNNTFYATFQVGQGLQLTLINNTINVTALPARYDSRDWGWVSPVRNQGSMGACWTFDMTGVLESALLKAAGLATDLSENNMQDTMLKYSIYGTTQITEGGGNIISTGYLLSWLGAFIQDADTYDELGKLSPVITTQKDIHVQDLMFTPNNEIPNGTQLKWAILKYGSIDVNYNGQSTYDEVTPYYRPDTHSQYVNVPIQPNHAVSVVGWDDNYPKENFGIEPPGDGAWIVKNSWGTDFGENGFLYVSYYDQSFLQYNPGQIFTYATSIIIENTVPYNKNYQYDLIWGAEFKTGNSTASYMNVFEALDDDLIAAVGTYFNQSGINYTVEIFVNDVLKLTQEGISPYLGYHTIKLNDYIPVKKGDVFKAVITSNGVPFIYLSDTRVHYTQNISFVSIDGQPWQDAYDLGYIACLKIYTIDESEPKHDTILIADYDDANKMLLATLTDDGGDVIAGADVVINIGGVNYTAETNYDGQAEVSLCDLAPGTYTADVAFNGNYNYNPSSTSIDFIRKYDTCMVVGDVSVEYGGDVVLSATLINNETGKGISGANVRFFVNDVKYTVKTNKQGYAILNISGLAPGSYEVQVSYYGNSKYNPSCKTVNAIVNKISTSISVYYDKSTKELVATLINTQTGKGISGANIVFNVNGVKTAVKSNKQGQARFAVEDSSLASAGVRYGGNSKYLYSTATCKINQSKISTAISMTYDKESQTVIASLVNAETGNGISGANVVFNFNKVKTCFKTNKQGQVMFSFLDLDPAVYYIGSSYGGNSKYTRSTTASNIVKI